MELIPEKTCCFTGHRVLPAGADAPLRAAVRRELLRMRAEGVDTFLAGGALGFDTLAAQEVLALRSGEWPEVRLVLVLPCRGQERRWSRSDAAVYREVLRSADEAIYTSEGYFAGCMFLRNRSLVDNSARCLCCWSGAGKGGTAYTVRYAKKKGLPVLNVWQDPEQTKLPV